MTVRVACIVEGHGEVEALPVLLRRIASELDFDISVTTPKPIRCKRDRLIHNDAELARAIRLAAWNAGNEGGIFLLLDAENDCPAELGPQLLERARQARNDLPIAVVVANREYEAWFLAAARSLRGLRGLPDNLQPPDDPETIRGAKEWLSRHMDRTVYSPTVDQPPLTAVMSLEEARPANSFDKCYREIRSLLTALASGTLAPGA